MVKSELIEILAARQPHLSKNDVELALNCILENIIAGLLAGERIEIRDFGSFILRHHPARLARNPKTGESVMLANKCAIHFKPGKGLKDQVNANRFAYHIKNG